MNSSLVALNALNFFMGDVRAGLGPFLGVFLQARHWSPAEIGVVMTIGGICGMVVTTPLGMLIDKTHAKRAIVVATALAITLASLMVLAQPTFPVAAVSQAASGIAGAAVGPAVAAITLGLVHQRGFAHQLGRNEAFTHAGTVLAAILAGVSGFVFGLGAVFVVLSVMAVLSIVATLRIDPNAIDYRAARGAAETDQAPVAKFSVLFRSKELMVLGATLTLFHLGNAAMLPLLGQAGVAQNGSDPSALTAATIIVAQASMVPVALFAAWLAEEKGYWPVFLLALIALPLRGAMASLVTGPWGLAPVQILDGFGAGTLGVAVPGLVARILAGTGHVNAGLGAVMTLQGIGAALSTTVGGVVAQHFGYSAAFLALGVIAAAALALWLLARPLMAPACGNHIRAPESKLAA
jgi:predicted MFS family arabinose efflux permease